MEWANKKILVVGLGKSGEAAARYAAMRGACVTIAESRDASMVRDAMARLDTFSITYRFGAHATADFQNADLIIPSPGVPLQIAPLQAARAAEIPIWNEMECALREITVPIIAITGTNGKTTTTALLGEIFRAAGRRVVVGGNIGSPLLDLMSDVANAEIVVLEVSSYQIEGALSLNPATTILLNITPDHLDHYPSFDAYVAAKKLLTDRLDAAQTLIVAASDVVAQKIGAQSRARCVWVRRDEWNDGRVRVQLPNSEQTWDLRQMRLCGAHNHDNVMAAGCAAALHGVEARVIEQTICAFAGLPHRCELVHEWNGVRFVDDSKGTNVGAVAQALAGFSAPVILIAGGLDKGTGYNDLREPVRQHVKQLITIGQARHIITEALQDCAVTIAVETMQDAVQHAIHVAAPGDVVLLSPACSSFDQYKNYAERGDDFVKWAKHFSEGRKDVGT